jgi:cytochrome bd-type quinol oxidase subunit 1
MRIEEGFSLAPGIGVAFIGFALLYLFLSSTLIWLLKRIATGAPDDADLEEEQVKEGTEEEGAYAL